MSQELEERLVTSGDGAPGQHGPRSIPKSDSSSMGESSDSVRPNSLGSQNRQTNGLLREASRNPPRDRDAQRDRDGRSDKRCCWCIPRRCCSIFMPQLVLRLVPLLRIFTFCAPDLSDVAAYVCVHLLGWLLCVFAMVAWLWQWTSDTSELSTVVAEAVWLPLAFCGVPLVLLPIAYYFRQHCCRCSQCRDTPWESAWPRPFTEKVEFGVEVKINTKAGGDPGPSSSVSSETSAEFRNTGTRENFETAVTISPTHGQEFPEFWQKDADKKLDKLCDKDYILPAKEWRMKASEDDDGPWVHDRRWRNTTGTCSCSNDSIRQKFPRFQLWIEQPPARRNTGMAPPRTDSAVQLKLCVRDGAHLAAHHGPESELRIAYELAFKVDESQRYEQTEHEGISGTYELKNSSKRDQKCIYVKGRAGQGVMLHHRSVAPEAGQKPSWKEVDDGHWYVSRLRTTDDETLDQTRYKAPGEYTRGPPEDGWLRVSGDYTMDESRLTVTGIRKYRFVVTTERRLNLNLAMGGILPGVDGNFVKRSKSGGPRESKPVVELRLLQLEAIAWGTLLMLAVAFAFFTYYDSEMMREQDALTALEHLKLLPQNMIDKYRHYVGDVFEDGVASSEVRMPIIMYVLVATVQAHEAASFSSSDSLQEMRDDKWYRKVHQARKHPVAKCQPFLIVVVGICLCGGLISMITGHLVVGAGLLSVSGLFFLWETTRIQLQSSMLSLALLCVCQSKKALLKELDNRLELVAHRQDGDFLDARDSRRRDELQQTFVEGIVFSKFRRNDFKNFFLAHGLDTEPLIEQKIEQLHDDETNVFRLDGDKEMVEVVDETEDSIPEATAADVCCVNSRAISDMIIKLAQARRLVHAHSRFRVLLILSLLHGAIPFFHAILPTHLGGGCAGHQPGLSASWVQNALNRAEDCYFSSWSSVTLHLVCMGANSALAFKLLSRLARCELDYFQRYWHMLYFVQLTPWSTIRDEKLQEHWGLLPKFDLNTPGNVEAWNKMRLYLQSYKIKQSKHLQVSVVWCFFGVFCLFLYEILWKLVLVQTPTTATLWVSNIDTTDYQQVCFILTSPGACRHVYDWERDSTKQPCMWYDPGETCVPQSNATQQCQGYCKVNPDWTELNVMPCTDNQCCGERSRAGHHNEITAVSQCTGKLSSGLESGCEWVAEAKSCQLTTQHFDVVAMFALCDTLLFGMGLLMTMWSGMKNNEIKKEGFAYIVRMKLSELLSNSMHFVSERWRWSRPTDAPRGWREYETALANIIENAIIDQEKARTGHSTRRGPSFTPTTTPLGTITESKVQPLISRPQNLDGALEAFAKSRNRDRHLRPEKCAETAAPKPPTAGRVPEPEPEPEHKFEPGFEPEPEPEPAAVDVSRPSSPQRLSGSATAGVSRPSSPQKLDEHVQTTQAEAKRRAEEEASTTISALVERIGRVYGVGMADGTALLEQALEQQHHSRTVAMLKVLADTLDHEYATGGKAHWGSEDRRTKMLFISLERPLMNSIIAVLATNVIAAASAAIWHSVNRQEAPLSPD